MKPTNHVIDEIASLTQSHEKLGQMAVEGTLLLVDMVASTQYKTRNSEATWLSRLLDFQQSVLQALLPLKPIKHVGDGILGFFPESEATAVQVLEKARQISKAITALNNLKPYKADHRIQVRQILNYGKAFIFLGGDPQGSAADKLFRMEKYVPDNCVGFTEEFQQKAQVQNALDLGRFRLKGLASGRHLLFLDPGEGTAPANSVDQARRTAGLHEIWDLGDGEGQICLVAGSIPPSLDQPSVIQVGDKHACLMALKHISRIGRLDDVILLESHEVREQHLKENIVCIGGPYWNAVTRRILREVHSPFIFDFSRPDSDETPLLDLINDSKHEARWNNGRLEHDVGFFARVPNPYNPDRHVILAAGIETSAVQGVVEVFSDQQLDFTKLVGEIRTRAREPDQRMFPPFFAAIHFDVDYTGKAQAPQLDQQIANIVTVWNPQGITKLQDAPRT